ncbi:MAG: hypothetical protein IIA45_16195, partial [Bacteroidetes bacterium]|nr:hypothetical protein [Bacteroidota bacterium]
MKHLIQTLKACVILVLFVHFQSITAQTTFQKTYAGNNWDFATSTIPSYDGGFMVAGYTYSFGAGKADVNLTKLDDKGVKLFSKTYGG